MFCWNSAAFVRESLQKFCRKVRMSANKVVEGHLSDTIPHLSVRKQRTLSSFDRFLKIKFYGTPYTTKFIAGMTVENRASVDWPILVSICLFQQLFSLTERSI